MVTWEGISSTVEGGKLARERKNRNIVVVVVCVQEEKDAKGKTAAKTGLRERGKRGGRGGGESQIKRG